MTLLTKLFFIGFSTLAITCSAQTNPSKPSPAIQTGADQMNLYLPVLQGKRVGLVVNHTSRVGSVHLVDSLIARGVTIKTIFAPEHGFRGQATDGEEISSSRDPRTGIMITSLYGKNRKPTPKQMDSLDVIVFDIQDVGVRFYTYTSTMHYVMEACAEAGKPMILLDRPNPNGHYIDGPVLDPKFKSFVGLNPIPVVYGLTMGELARMINGEGWLAGAKTCPLTVVPLKNYTHQTPYILPVPPSPNLPNQQAVLLYPSLCFFEGTVVSVGRGTDKQFQVIGSPYTQYGPYTFTPVDKPGAVNPPLEGQLCYGLDLSNVTISKKGLVLDYFFDFFKRATDKSKFFLANNGIDRLVGTDQLRLQLLAGVSENKIRESWEPGLNVYKQIRKKYVLYP
ncbi:exo-beta-N-acetylmuramidase NamZ family protein [Spirosoma flavum]|uniref:Exo-beta-N-acetylmuramidase NamZ domain-containing protein n=1 Tax=Spirosoma flavum TaxID=2048557 RepID=A0ABW6AR48_9BACT